MILQLKLVLRFRQFLLTSTLTKLVKRLGTIEKRHICVHLGTPADFEKLRGIETIAIQFLLL